MTTLSETIAKKFDDTVKDLLKNVTPLVGEQLPAVEQPNRRRQLQQRKR